MTTLTLWFLIQLNIGKTNFAILPKSRQGKKFTVVDRHLRSGFLVNTEGCRIPYLDPFDPSVQQFIFDEEDTKCEETYGMPLVESNSTALFINESALAYYSITDVNDLQCCYTPFWRVELNKEKSGIYPENIDSQVRFANTCTSFSGPVKITEEFVKIQCFLDSTSSDEPIYTDFHAFNQIRNITKKRLYDPLTKNSVSVLIIGVDSVSRLNVHRQMPLTVRFLKSNLSVVEFLGYNKVADNTFLNLIPVLTGLSEENLIESCWPSQFSVFDDCNFVWNQYRKAGYTTAFSEDAQSKGGIFSYLFRGFRKQPTDYYTRPFNVKTEEDIGFNKRKGSNLCLGPRKSLKVLLNNAFTFTNTMKHVLSFGLFWGSSLTHDFLNLPKRGDVDHEEFLGKLYNAKILDRTILVFMSDHGMRYGDIRQTYQGYLEERLPFLFIAYPKWFRERYATAVNNMKRNADKLTTPFDLHETLQDLVNLTSLEADVLRTRSQDLSEMQNLPRGISLFLPIPGIRTCEDAGIVDHWCTCHQSVSVPTNNTQVRSAADYLVGYINSLLKDYPLCARLQLQNITNAREEKATSHQTFETSDVGITDYSLTIQTVPGEALFESTVRYDGIISKFAVIGTVSRINLYGNQSSCISHFKLRLYCYCI